MKRATTIFIFMALFSGLIYSQTTETPDKFQLTWSVALTSLAAIYEVLSRIIPTSKGWSIIGKVLEVLTFLSNLFDRRKK